MDLNKSLRLAIDTGKVSVGSKQSCKAINSGSAKLIILASNCPEETLSVAENGKTPVYSFNGNNSVLGAACGKPFPVSAISILDGGKSDILNLKGK
ncbi:MAG: 50S ribosomal protein L30e [Acidimicrobiaceae bacterium]|uniref:Ribosomal protein eL8/eL30/eS12/Gadd45 domain-containing protein n=1 Tax=marine metagenome TaxID=408172 RepID=A0A382L6F0_9ZZZZ|nr:50S ribosomal protein L30e [Acidimicrobiaceae bacterium]|tara:strand:+ start:301 stop:588 length:288 start_codon:yes stop_codon:yes gene_type:complete